MAAATRLAPAWAVDVRRDVAYGVRTLGRNPGFSAVVILTLALGIGANTAIFSVVNGVLLQPLPYEFPERQVRLLVTTETRTGAPNQQPLRLTAAETEALAERTRAFDRVGNIGFSLTNWRGHEPRWSGGEVTASVFPMLGVRPVLGRLFGPEDEREGAPNVLILSYGSWQRHFARDPGVLGRSITLEPALGPGGPASAKSYTVVGVMPSGFEYLPGTAAQYWIPLRSSDTGRVVARLAAGVSADAATAGIEPVLRDLRRRRAEPDALGYSTVGLQQELVAPVKPALLVLMGAVGFVLLIACLNVANLLLVRSVARQREMAIRTAIGAGQARILRLMMTESLLLTAVAAILGTGLAAGGVQLLRRLATTIDRIDLGQGDGRMIPRVDSVHIDGSVLAFTVGVAALVGILFGLITAMQHRRHTPFAALRNEPAAAGARLRRSGLRSALIVVEVALSIVLLVGGGLLIRSFIGLLRVDVGYEAARVLTFQVSLPSERYPLPRLRLFAEEFVSRLQSQPGVVSAAYANQLPLVRLRDTLAVSRTPGSQPSSQAQGADVRVVSRGYFETMHIPLTAGRTFEQRDGAGQPRVLIINEALARRDFGDSANAVGQRVYVAQSSTPWTIVGVVADVRQWGVDRAAEPQFFLDARQWGEDLSPLFPLGPYYTVRYGGGESAAITTVRTLLEQAEVEGVLFNVAPMNEIISTTVARPRMYAVLLGVLAALGVTMALVGIYGVISYTVSQRTRELGIRMALGAPRAGVLGLVLRESLVLTALGLGLGLLGAAALTRTLESMLFELTPLDPPTFAGIAVLFVLFAGLAAYVPARRATLIDPLVALRTE